MDGGQTIGGMLLNIIGDTMVLPGWGDSVNEKSYSKNAPVFTGNITENQTK